MTDFIPVPVGDCRCPGAPHGDGDVVYLAPELSMAGGMAVRQAIISGLSDQVEAQAALARIWLREIRDWTFVDEDGEPIPVSETAAQTLLPYGKGGRLVADKADDLYAQDVVDPLLAAIRALEKPSPRGPTPSTELSAISSGHGSSTRSSRKKRRS